MGIYDNGNIFGIRIYNLENDDFENILFEKTYDELINNEEKKQVYLFYKELNNKDELRFKYYTKCVSTYRKGTFLMWYPISLNLFLENFNV